MHSANSQHEYWVSDYEFQAVNAARGVGIVGHPTGTYNGD